MSIVGGNAVFSCLSPSNIDDSIVSIQWLLNGISSDQVANDSSVSVTTKFSEIINTGRLILEDLSTDFNETVVQCITEFDSEPPLYIVSSRATLLIQGMLIR